jgi:hypothetical protein
MHAVTHIHLSILCQKTLLVRIVEFGKFIPRDIIVDRISGIVTPFVEIPSFLEVIHTTRQRECE